MRDKSKTLLIDMNQFRLINHETNKLSNVLVSFKNGEAAKNTIKLMSIQSKYDYLDFVIPYDVLSITPSFLRGLFAELIVKLGPDKFNEKVHFTSSCEYRIYEDIQEVVSMVMRENQYDMTITTDYFTYFLFGCLNFMAIPYVWFALSCFYTSFDSTILTTIYFIVAFGLTIMGLNYVANKSLFVSIKKRK